MVSSPCSIGQIDTYLSPSPISINWVAWLTTFCLLPPNRRNGYPGFPVCLRILYRIRGQSKPGWLNLGDGLVKGEKTDRAFFDLDCHLHDD